MGDDQPSSSENSEEEHEQENVIRDLTDSDTNNLKKTIYLSVMSSVDFEECANKMLKLKIRPGQEIEVASMLIECCMHERTYLRFYGLLAQRFCILNPVYQEYFEQDFVKYFSVIDRYETNKLRNIAKFFAHLLFTDAISWAVLRSIRLTQEDTTSSSRIFIKILMQEMAENISIENLMIRFADKELKTCFDGLFLTDSSKNIRFCINFFTSIGLGRLTDELREILAKIPVKEDRSSSESESESSSGSSSVSRQSQAKKNLQRANRLLNEELGDKKSEKKRERSRD